MNFGCVRAGLIVAALIFPSVSMAEEDRVWPRGTYTVQIETDRIANTTATTPTASICLDF